MSNPWSINGEMTGGAAKLMQHGRDGLSRSAVEAAWARAGVLVQMPLKTASRFAESSRLFTPIYVI